MEFWFIYIYIILITTASSNQRKQRRKRLKPVVHLEPNEFENIVGKYKSKTIIVSKMLFQGFMYVIQGDDYYYRTTSKTPLLFPRDCEVLQAKSIHF